MITFYSKYKKELEKALKGYDSLFIKNPQSIFYRLQNKFFVHKLRYYQMEALYILDVLIGKQKSPELHKVYSELLESHGKESPMKIPFLGFEMATGSGKTLFMGACIYYLYAEQKIKNFLIITPKSLDIYNKTIRNFKKGGADSIWKKDAPLNYNLITGDDYNHLYFDKNKELNIFIFNIDKFGPNAKNTSKKWESSFFEDNFGNKISVKEYLNTNDLVIITDEAHHAQSQKEGGSGNIIKNFYPKIVLEFTATALESTKSDEKRAQKVVYKYDIKRFLEDKFGKRIKAVALDTGTIKKSKNKIPDNEKWKLITLYLFHILKKKSLSLSSNTNLTKPLALVKVKDDSIYSEKIYEYITKELSNDDTNIKIILDKIKTEEIDVVPILKNLLEEDFGYDLNRIKKELDKLTSKVLLYSGTLDTEKKTGFIKIQTNLHESIVYIKRLDEGIDIPNIYTIAVINDNESDFKTSVKQIIGRGVRLSKPKREFDAELDILQAQSEILHIICDRGKNFEKVIEEIKHEFDLNDSVFSFNSRQKVKIINKVKAHLLSEKQLPIIKAVDKVKKNVTLSSLMSDSQKIIDSFIQHNCSLNSEKNKVYLKFVPTPFFSIVDVFSDDFTFLKEMEKNGVPESEFCMEEEDKNEIYHRILKRILHIPDNQKYKEYILSNIQNLQERSFHYFYSDNADVEMAKRRFKDSFCYFYENYILKYYYDVNYNSVYANEYVGLEDVFKDTEIMVSEDAIGNKQKKKLDVLVHDRNKMTELIKNGFYFYGYKHCLYDYTKFDSYTEKQLADYLDKLISILDNEKDCFWVKSERNFHFQYGNKRYFPDFVFHSSSMYIIETKAEPYSNQKKNILLEKVNELDGDAYKGLLIFSDQMDEIEKQDYNVSFDYLLGASEQSFHYEGYKRYIVPSVSQDLQFKEFLPVYSVQAAAGYFSRSQESRSEGWLPVKKKNYSQTSFIVQVKGNSMSPRINDGELCIFDHFYSGTKNGKIVLVQHRNIDDPDNGGKYTVKTYFSEKIQSEEELLGNFRITLKPMNKNYKPIILNKVQEQDIEFIGVFVDKIDLKSVE